MSKFLNTKAIFRGAVCGADPATDPVEPTVEPVAEPIIEPTAPPATPAAPSDNEAKLLKESMARKAKLVEQEKKIQELTEQLNRFSGVDLDEVKTLIETKKNAEIKALEEKGQWEALKAQMRDENAKVVKETVDKLTLLQDVTSKQQAIIDRLTLGNAFNTSNFILNDLNLSPEKAKIIYGDRFDLEGDKVIAYDKSKGATDRVPLVDANGDSLSFEEAIKKIVDADPDKNLLMKIKAKPGAGSGTASINPKPVVDMGKGISRIEAALAKSQK